MEDIKYNSRGDGGIIFNLHFIGREDCSPGHRYIGMRSYFLLHYIEEGRGRAGTTASNAGLLEKGNCFLYHPNSIIWYKADDDFPWTYRWIAFSAGSRQRSYGLPVSSSPLLFDTGPSDQIGGFYDRIETAVENSCDAVTIERLILILLHSLSEKIRPGASNFIPRETGSEPASAQYVKAAKLYIEHNYQNDINVQSVADYIGLDRSYFSRIFSAAEGKSVRDYLIGHRISTACHMLKQTDLSVRAIASSSGYTDYTVFARRFRSRTGLSAGDYRKKYRQN